MNDSTWTWMSGGNTINQKGVYGEKGVPSADIYPGARHGAVALYDDWRQVFWLFGGVGYGNSSENYQGS